MENKQIIERIESFFQQKKQPVLAKILKEAVKVCGEKIAKSSESQEMKDQAKALLDSKRPKEQSELEYIQEKYTQLLNLNYQNPIFLSDVKSDTAKSIIALDEKFTPSKWLADGAKKASGVVLDVTHIAKLTHSSARASNVNALILGIQQPKTLLASVNSVGKLPIDFAYSTAEYAPIAEFLQLNCAGEMLGKILCDNPAALKPFAQDDTQLQQWQEQFSLAFNEKNKSSHALAKQVYFPLRQAGDYHLLTPLVSSSLAQVIYDRIRQKDTPEHGARNKKIYSPEIVNLFYKTSVLKATQSNHQNVSYLNGKRFGQLILLPAIPPQWKAKIKPPIHLKTFFNKTLAAQAREPLIELKNLLLAIKANKLSVNLQRKQIIRSLIMDIADVVFDNCIQIQKLNQNCGWSQESRLPIYQQYWLDPLRGDEEFQAAKVTLDWSSDLAIDFSKWINQHIKHKQLTLGAAHEKQWQKLFIPLLREFNALTEANLDTITAEMEA
ncbi:type I-F CRISPR-associated protein Csy1 [Methylovulum psychrotolerans]|uniref:type I-F CRISPR-associated protein Csy1 n=1 Tax=Methylovulum psychrotolerans TaxID=1704499 RepID=UPI001BFF5667|nr:type I-F CRISPR-associated protein Csy1 [Methylovulum psychrotolerans]MBT9099651.1 type I-F CRISPR-associated protein Csy1 [Methylovulum psychrotolerans]